MPCCRCCSVLSWLWLGDPVTPVASKWLAGRHRFVLRFVLEALRLGSGHLRVALEEYMVVATTWTPGLEGRSIADLIEKLKLRAATVSVVSDVDGAFAWSSFSDAAFTQINGLAWTRTQDRGQQPSFYENELRSVRGTYGRRARVRGQHHQRDARDDLRRGRAWTPWTRDSGGPIIFNDRGEVCGMHIRHTSIYEAAAAAQGSTKERRAKSPRDDAAGDLRSSLSGSTALMSEALRIDVILSDLVDLCEGELNP